MVRHRPHPPGRSSRKSLVDTGVPHPASSRTVHSDDTVMAQRRKRFNAFFVVTIVSNSGYLQLLRSSNAAIDRCRSSGGRIFSRHGRTNFLGLTWQSIDTHHLFGSRFSSGRHARGKYFFSPSSDRVHGHPSSVVSYMVNNLCGRRMSTTIAMELYDETNKHCCDQVSSVPHIRPQGSAHDSSQVTPLPTMRN